MEEPLEDLGAAYRAYRPLLFGALAALARRGVAVPFDEGLGLVHDFFIDGYPVVLERYDARIAKFTTFLYAAFTRYARPRILRLARIRQALVGDDLVERAAGGAELDPATEIDRATMRAALARVSADDRELLQSKFGEGLSERAIAERAGVTRQRIRQRLLEALGRLVVELGERPDLSSDDLIAARAVWTEDRSLDEAAAILGKTTEQVRRAVSRVLAGLARGLST
jgi:RNA polymerase sigma factor (sigma-70 family)